MTNRFHLHKYEPTPIFDTRNTRKSTNRLLEMIEDGSINPKDVVMMCVKFMSEDDVAEMCRINEVFHEEEEDDLD
jgi:hypothetical protein